MPSLYARGYTPDSICPRKVAFFKHVFQKIETVQSVGRRNRVRVASCISEPTKGMKLRDERSDRRRSTVNSNFESSSTRDTMFSKQ